MSADLLLRRFAGTALDTDLAWLGDWDGGHLQDTLVECGLLAPHTVETPCGGDNCECEAGGTCYRMTDLGRECYEAAKGLTPPAPLACCAYPTSARLHNDASAFNYYHPPVYGKHTPPASVEADLLAGEMALGATASEAYASILKRLNTALAEVE